MWSRATLNKPRVPTTCQVSPLLGDAVIPFGPPSSLRDKGTASWHPRLAVVMGHVKHAQAPHEPPNLTHGVVVVIATALSPNHFYLHARHTQHGPSPPTQAPIAYPPCAYTNAPRSLGHHYLTPGPSHPSITEHGVDAVPPGQHTPDKVTHTGSLSSREGNHAYWIPPPDGGVQHLRQPGCFLRHVRPITAVHGLCRTRSRSMPKEITTDGRNISPLAHKTGGNTPGICCYDTQMCNKKYRIYEGFYHTPIYAS
jgi:hypothetical protein